MNCSLFRLLLLATFLTHDAAAEDVPAPAPASRVFTTAEKGHWSFQKVRNVAPPDVGNAAIHPIDRFIVAALKQRRIEPNPAADRATAFRRACLDLTGLPPSPAEMEEFLADRSPQGWSRALERLLASPHYGERWARHWLDLARYAESEGFKADETRPNAWRYRDYVIDSFNRDKPYDRFVEEQIAGDELWPDDPGARLATAFNRHYPDESNARNLMQRRQEILNDITDTVGAVFTGLTYACARCHDHKFDPILQADYYRLQAFFANTTADDRLVMTPPDEHRAYQARLAQWEEQTAALREELRMLEEPKRRAIIDDYVEKYPEQIREALAKPEGERSPFECLMVAKAKLYIDPQSHQYIADTAAVAGKFKGAEKKRWEELRAELKQFDSLHPGALPMGTGIKDLSGSAPMTRVLSRGLYDAPTEPVTPGFLSILDPSPTAPVRPGNLESTGRRTALARLLTDPENPLPARVIVNRVWQYHFGRGLVGTASDFGMKGDRPTHPELLDWLTTEFIRGGWRLKRLHRLIMTSATYQQSSGYDQASARVDPENRLLWRYPRHRLEGETIRDAALAVAGLLNPAMGGPSVFPELPEGMSTRGGWKVSGREEERNRRSVYVFVRRNTRYPMFLAFDMPDTHESCARRNVTTSPVQALTLLNSELSLGWARHFARRVLSPELGTTAERVTSAYQLAYGRSPTAEEVATAEEFMEHHRQIVEERLQRGEKVALPAGHAGGTDRAAAATWVDLCHMLINANEFVYVN